MLVLYALALAAVRRERVAVDTEADLRLVEKTDAVRREGVAVDTEADLDLDETAGDSSLCDESLFVSYKGDWQGRTVNTAEGTWRLDPGEWSAATLVTKKSRTDADGECTRTYTAMCEEAVIKIKKTCENSCQGEDECIEKRTLSRQASSAFVYKSKGTDLDVDGSDGEYALEVYDPDWQNQHLYDPETKKWGKPEEEFGTLTRDTRVSWVASKAGGGVKLRDIPWMGQSWKAPTGCYCCKHSYNFLSNPFANANGAQRMAWNSAGGQQECMLAWSELPEDLSLSIFPRLLAMIADRFTLTIGSHATCSATCASVSKEFMMHKHSFMKFSESYY